MHKDQQLQFWENVQSSNKELMKNKIQNKDIKQENKVSPFSKKRTLTLHESFDLASVDSLSSDGIEL